MEIHELDCAIEAILFVAGEPTATNDLANALDVTSLEIESALTRLESTYDEARRGVRLLRFGEHVQLATRLDYAPYIVRVLQPVQKQALSQAAMETLAVIAFNQPSTRGDIEQIRGVKCDTSLQTLITKGLVQELGRKDTLGRPILYGTTDAFLRHFGVGSLQELSKTIKNDRKAGSNYGKEDGENQKV